MLEDNLSSYDDVLSPAKQVRQEAFNILKVVGRNAWTYNKL